MPKPKLKKWDDLTPSEKNKVQSWRNDEEIVKLWRSLVDLRFPPNAQVKKLEKMIREHYAKQGVKADINS